MGSEINSMWMELAADLSTQLFYVELMVLAISLSLAWLFNRFIQSQVMRHAPESWKIGIGGAKRLLFPLSSLMIISLGILVLRHGGYHVSMLKLASSLLVAMAVIRLAVYTLRYVFAPSTWLHAMENTIVSMVWVLVLLHLAGFLPELLQALKDVSFTIGHHTISLWLILQALVIVVVTIVVALSVSRFLENKLMRAEQIDMNLRVVMSKLVRIILTLVGMLTALSAVGFDITLLSVFGGALGVGLGFGLQKIASNYVSGFIILLERSVHMGDVITVDSHYGVVNQIRSRYLVLRKLDGVEVVIPNEMLISNPIINHSLTDRNARITLPVMISYESSLETAMELVKKAACDHPRVMDDPAPEVQVLGFGDNGIDLHLVIWIPDPEEGSGSLKSALYLAIWRAFQQHAISVPYPQRDIRIIGSGLK
jgi:small-conductance mechanosensitive channel